MLAKRPSAFRNGIALLHHPIHHLLIQLIPGLPKRGDHRRHLGIARSLPHLKPTAGNNPLITCAHQPCVKSNHHVHLIAPLFTLESLQLAAQLIVGLQVGLVGAQ